ncbi:MAG: FtsX-like permease family protein [Paraclostridium bifermentans]|uniref:ABC transporter permease n=1 Tax=Paraclostridium bifermentans TaxID=1490 RepID=UPI0011DE2FC6|nr:FtsX-like permease family protein [Paraclostridium bifermentans]MBS6506627.1 FtsX-like permease family protein [Paraclostridium bifermentans]MDU3801397.1 FtsX-like permease family protein [Paraclostridium bifermentans]
MINTTKIAKSNLKQNKSKSTLIIITIILATTLLTAVGLTCADWDFLNKENVRKYSGTQHGVYAKIDEQKLKQIKAHSQIEKVGIINGIGSKDYEDETKIGIGYIDNNASEFNNKIFIDGKLPTKKNEIALDDLALEKMGYEKKIGQKINLEYDDFTKKGITKSEFILTGITKVNEISKLKKAYSGIVSKNYMESTRDMNKELSSVLVTIKGENKLSGEELISKVEKIGKDLDIPKGSIKVNEDYINTLKPDTQVIMWGSTIAIIVILSSILVIYNIFYLSITSKVQEFGKLRAIGATKKQIKTIVLKEGIFLSTIAVPLGIVLGYVINKFVLVNLFFNGADVQKLPIIIGVMAVSFLTVFISLLKPMKVASKVSIIDAVRYSGDIKTKSKNRKGYKYINIKRLSNANLKRNKKRTYVTIISLSLSGIIFVVMASILNCIDAEKMARRHFPYDISLNLSGYTFGEEDSPNTEFNILQTKNPLGKDFRGELLNMDGVVSLESGNSSKVQVKSFGNEYKYEHLSGIDEKDLEDLEFYLEDGKIDIEKLKSGDEMLFTYPELAKEFGIKAGDNITLTLYDGKDEFDKTFKIQAITSGPGIFTIHDDAFKKLFKTDTTDNLGIHVAEGSYDEVKEFIKNLDKSNEYIDARYIDDEIESNNMIIGMTKAVGYSLVIIIGVIGFMNLINSMITSIITRKKELGMLQAIGLTDKQLIKMLNIEAMFYTGTMLLSSLTLGSGLGYIAVYVFRKTGASYASYSFPIMPILTMVLCIVIAQLTLTYIISKNFNKESLIDRVRYNE